MKLAVKDGSGVTEIVGTYSDKNDKITLNFVERPVEFYFLTRWNSPEREGNCAAGKRPRKLLAIRKSRSR